MATSAKHREKEICCKLDRSVSWCREFAEVLAIGPSVPSVSRSFMATIPLLLSGGAIAGILLCIVCAALIFVLLRNRVRCPHDNSSMALVRPKDGKLMVFRCPKCQHEVKTKISIGKR
jgi:hypothetical protein